MSTAGLLLAAGAGRRMGGPKALLRDGRGVPFLDRAVGTLLDGGCDTVTVVLGAAADAARRLLDEAGWTADPAVDVVVGPDWAEGMGASLRTGLSALLTGGATAALVTLVDLPDLDAQVVARVLEHWAAGGEGDQALLRATYDGRPGHPVLLGSAHWRRLLTVVRGDVGAQRYFDLADDHPPARRLHEVDCTDLATGRDVDTPAELDS